MKILVINSGSSSIKYKLLDMESSTPLCIGIVERIGSDDSLLTHQKTKSKSVMVKVRAGDHSQAIKNIFNILTGPGTGVLNSCRQISAIGHRVVHGADAFTESTIINDKVIRTITKFNNLAPLHNPPALLGIDACRKFAKDIPQVAVFDTAFHQTMPAKAYVYGLPYELYENLKIRRYGFHGTSHKFVAQKASQILKRDLSKLKIVTCHIGNGCSITAVKNGRSIDTSMGFTPLEGLLMGTRSGDIDPAIIPYLMEKKNLNIDQIKNMLNKKSGLLGISGVSNDMRDILKACKSGNKRARLALDIFIYRIQKYIGAYAACMDGLDVVVLTAGIAEHAPVLKQRIAGELRGFLSQLKAKVLVISTDEEQMIAQETLRVISKERRRK